VSAGARGKEVVGLPRRGKHVKRRAWDLLHSGQRHLGKLKEEEKAKK